MKKNRTKGCMILILIIIVSVLYYLRYKTINYGDLTFHLIYKQEYKQLKNDIFSSRYINEKKDFFYFANETSMPDTLRTEILNLLDLDNFDYIISRGYQVIRGRYSAEYTKNDGISKNEDSRIPVDFTYSSQTEDFLYIYKVFSKKGGFRMSGP